ncbi:glycosyltransferase family 4 protein [bacterium]|nr:glycosyltransferase family 4 protein [bacterium]
MRIGIDCRTILNPQKEQAIGVGHYSYQLLRHLLKVDEKNQYVLFFDRSVEKKKLDKFKRNNVEIKFFPFSIYQKFLSLFYTRFLTSAFFSREKLDIFHSPVINLPSAYESRTIITVHDLAIFRLPRLYPPKLVEERKKKFPQVIKQADKIIAVSQSTKNDLQKLFKVPNSKIKVIYNGLDARFFRRNKPAEIKRVKNKYHIQGNYILFLSRLEKRKNCEKIIKSFVRFKNKNKKYSQYKLVMAGKCPRRFKKTKDKIVKSLPIKYAKEIIFPGYIDSDDINALYQGATIFLFPSLYEGFGLPIIEAMSKGVPVITSNNSSMSEIAKESALLVNPYKTDSIVEGLEKILGDKNLFEELKKKGIKKAKEFSWDKCAKETLKLYKKVKRNVSKKKN